MTPLRLVAANYGPYASLNWEIPVGLTSVVGRNLAGDGADSNGAGKTKLLELIPICLFGPPLPWNEYLTAGAEETVCTVALEFEHAGERYRVRRTYDAKGRGKTLLDLEIAHRDMGPSAGETWAPLTRESQTETQATLESLIGLSKETFAHSVFASQGGRHFADPSLPPRERKAILTEALNLGVWDDLRKLVDADVADVKREMEAIDQRLGAFQDDLAQAGQAEEDHGQCVTAVELARRDVSACEEAEIAAREKHDALKVAAEARSTLTERLHYAEREQTSVEVAGEESLNSRLVLRDIEESIARLEPIAADAEALVAQVNAVTVADAMREQAERERLSLLSQASGEEARATTAADENSQYGLRCREIREEIERRLNGDPGSCNSCGQLLAGEALEKAIASLRFDHEALRERSSTLDASVAAMRENAATLREQAAGMLVVVAPATDRVALQHRTATAQDAAKQLVALKERQTHLAPLSLRASAPEFVQRALAAQTELTAATRALEQAPPLDPEALPAAARDLERAGTDLVAARATDRQLAAQLAAFEERLRNLAALAERSQEALLARAGLAGRLDVLSALARSYGRDGIPALLLEALALPHLETEANRILDQLDARMRFELVTQRENKGGGLKDTLDVVVHGEAGTLRYESYSGGEQTRLAFALRVALARLVVQNGAEVSILCLDELSYLDGTGIAKMCEVLRGLSEFRSVIVVSHDERFVEAFDQSVTVVRDENGSRLEEAA